MIAALMGSRLVVWGVGFFTRAGGVVMVAVMLAGLVAFTVQTMRLIKTRAAADQFVAQVAQRDAAQAQTYIREQVRVRAIEQALQDQAEQTRKNHAAQLKTIDIRHAAVVAGLRSRADRPATTTAGAAAAPACAGGCATGAGLYRPDAEFLAGFAAAAAQTGAERDACTRQYDDARQALNPVQP